jgi:LmbE family N-acetylglucosaminyl deacetylase
MKQCQIHEVAVVVAHPDDETLWVGGTLLMERGWNCRILGLCRAGDPDRAPKFQKAIACLNSTGELYDCDDGPEQRPLPPMEMRQLINRWATGFTFDLVITHGPWGEYTRHLRHEEVFRAVFDLWSTGAIVSKSLWSFAYEDGHGSHLPRAICDAHRKTVLSSAALSEKRRIVQEIYGFLSDSWEARAILSVEAFWCFSSPEEVKSWICRGPR